MRAAFGSRTSGSRTNHEGKSITWSTPSASMSARRAWGSRQPASRPNFAFHASVPGVSAPTSRLDQPGQPTSAALDRSREAGTARPLISRTSVSVWKWNWVFTQARTSRGTYSSQIAGGSTMWLSQSKIGKALAFITSSSRSDGQQGLAGRGLDAEGVERAGDHRVVADDGGEVHEALQAEAGLERVEVLVAHPVLAQQGVGRAPHLRLVRREPGRRLALADGGDDLVTDSGLARQHGVGRPLVLRVERAGHRDDGQLAHRLRQRAVEAHVVTGGGDASRQLGAVQQRGERAGHAAAALADLVPRRLLGRRGLLALDERHARPRHR